MAAGILYALLAAFLVACSSLSELPSAGHLAAEDDPAYLLTIDLADGDTQEQVLSRHGGEIVAWVEGEFAVIGLSADAVQRPGEFSLQSVGGAEPNLQFAIDPNAIEMQGTSSLWAGGTSTLWAGGTSRIWAGGTSYLWAGGTSYLWAGGKFQWMPENSDAWKQIGLEEAHELARTTLGRGVKVAVIDTGVDLHHPALKEAVAPGRDYIDNDSVPQEEGDEGDAGYGHGTNVAGIIRQVAPRATIVPIRILGPDGSGSADDLVRAIFWAVFEADADIINLSLGGAQEVGAVSLALGMAALNGVHVVTSSGDSGNRTVTFPASVSHLSPYLLSLTSVDADDRKSELAPHHEEQIEMSSVGDRIFGPAPDMRAAAWSGTSMAAPMAAGALALALGAERAGADLDVADFRLMSALMASSENIDSKNPGYEGELGAGRLEVATFLSTVLDLQDSPGRGNGNGRWDRPWERGHDWAPGHRGDDGRGDRGRGRRGR